MKKEYVKPEIEVVECESETYMLSQSGLDDMDPGVGDGGDLDAQSNRHRGEWGNLWAED